MKSKSVFILGIAFVTVFLSCNKGSKSELDAARQLDYLPSISPDYIGLSMPYNIAPLNFKVTDKAENFYISISADKGDAIEFFSKNGMASINIDEWHELLGANKGDRITYDIYALKKDSGWVRYKRFTNYVAVDAIDDYLVYRLINRGHVLWNEMGIYQRNLTNFEEKPLVKNNLIDRDCINCHNFSNHNPKKMSLHVRGLNKGTMIYNNGKLTKINTNIKYTMASAVYPAWHPNGKLIAYSVNKINQAFHNNGGDNVEVYDKASDLIIYDVEKNEISTSPKISTYGRETFPTWSPDGKYLYYCCAPKWESTIPADSFRYSLLRIAFDPATKVWGNVDTIINAKKLHMSVTIPRISPDGRYLLITMATHGSFTIFYDQSDIYLLDMSTNKLSKAPINTDKTESYHSWSSNGKWVVFSSKRLNSIHTRPFICHFYNGNFTKPFVLPQENPDFYETFLRNYNIPEFITGPVELDPVQWADAIHEKAKDVGFDPTVDIDALSGASMIKK